MTKYNQKQVVTIYQPSSEGVSFLFSILNIVRDIRPAHELAMRLFLRDIKSQYRQSFLGFFWYLIPPLLTAALWMFLNQASVISMAETSIPYPLFVIIGTVLWQVFAESINQPLQSVMANKSILTKINFPRESLLLSGLYTVVFNFWPKILVLIAGFFYFNLKLSIGLIFFPAGMVAILFLGFTIGLLLTPVGLLLNDVARGIGVILPFAMYLTPVVYPIPATGYAAIVMEFNPMAKLLNYTRDWFSGYLLYIPNGFYLIVTGTFLLFMIGMLAYRLSMPIITERFGG